MPREVNLPPIGVLTADTYENTLPSNIFNLDATLSTDPNRRGRVDRVKFWGDNNIVFTTAPDVIYPHPYKATVVCKEGATKVYLQCWDKAGNASEVVSINLMVKPAKVPMKVGVKIQQAPIREMLNSAEEMMCDMARPNSGCVTGNRALEAGNCPDWKREGFLTWMNIGFYENPSAKPYNFLQPSQRAQWASGFEILCQKLQGYADGIAIENEQCNAVYFQFPENWLENYIEQLKIAIPIARKYGIMISDGSVPIEDVEIIMEGNVRRERTRRVQAFLQAIKDVDVDYVLFHAHYNVADDRNPVKDLQKTIKYLEEITGHKAFSNELSMEGATSAVITWFLQGCDDAGCPYTVFWSGDGGTGNSKGDEISATNDLGKAIISWQNNH